ncbi:MAG: hypothetical protein CMM94_05370 [Rickettsiales bacterium]|nr:hypothetical protein [Rickettsiales bacterium]
MRFLISFFILLLCSSLALAQSRQPIIFQKDSLTITSYPRAEKSEEQEGENAAPPTPTEHVFSVEVRPENAMRLEWIHTLNTLDNNRGVMIAFETPMQIPLMPLEVYKPVDVLFIDNDGKILQIAPSVVLGELQQDIYAKKPIRAFLYLQGGISESLNIKPRDEVDHPLFNSAPVVLE